MMTTQVAAPIAYPIFSTPPRLCRLPTFPLAPRQNRRLSLPRISVLVESSDDSDDEGTLLSYRLKDYKRARAPSPDDLDYLDKRTSLSPRTRAAAVEKKKPIDAGENWDYYIAPLSPLSDLTESDTSDSDDDVQSNPTKTDETSRSPRPTPRLGVGAFTPSPDAHPPSQSSSGLKRKRSCDSGISSTPDSASSVDDSERPPKRRRRMSVRTFGVEHAEESTTVRDPLAMLPDEIKKSVRRHKKAFGTVRKPRLANFRPGRS